jgi:hypothetical protein
MKTRREFLGAMAPLALGSWIYAAENEVPPAPEPLTSTGFETLFLTWAGDPTRSMRVQWLSENLQMPTPVTLRYRLGEGNEWKKAASTSHPFGGITHWVNRVDLSDLTPGVIYDFKVGDNSEIYRFKTAPEKLDETVVFAEGGDVGTDPVSVPMLHRQAASWNPLFGFVGGDLSYSNARDVAPELRYYKQWNAHMRAEGNRLIPMVVGIGNHEVNGGYQKTRAEAPYFYALFDGLFKGGGAYGTLDFGDYLSLIILDSHHTCRVELQTEWLRASLAKRENVRHRFVAYHVPAYPSVRKFEESVSSLVRQHWVPVMEAARVKVVFEHHDHAFKRTRKLFRGKESPDGITYCGDGDWGRPSRPIRAKEIDYLLKSAQSMNVIKVSVSSQGSEFLAVNEKGEELDRFVIS